MKVPGPQMTELLRRCGDYNQVIALEAQRQLATALTSQLQKSMALQLPLKSGPLMGDNIEGIFEEVPFAPGVAPEFPIDFITPANATDLIAVVVPSHGKLQEYHVEGSYVMVPFYEIGATIDWDMKYARDARWDVAGRAMRWLEAARRFKKNRDGWRVLLASASSRNLTGYDDAAVSGLFTKRLVEILRVYMERNGGGNATSENRSRLTDLWLSPEGHSDIRSWDVTQVDEVTRREIFVAANSGTMTRIFGVNLHSIYELGVSQEYQTYWTGTLANSMPTDKVELVIGMDLLPEHRDSFVMPTKEGPVLQENFLLTLQRRVGWQVTEELGFGALSAYRIIAGAF